MKWVRTTTPDPLFLWSQIKAHLRCDDDIQRSYVMDEPHGLLPAATAHAEQMLEMSLMEREMRVEFWENDLLHLPRGPVIEVLSCTDANENDVTFSTYTVGNSDRLELTSNVSKYPLTVVYRAGHQQNEYVQQAIDADIADAIRVHVAIKWRFRDELTSEALAMIQKLDAFYAFKGRGLRVA